MLFLILADYFATPPVKGVLQIWLSLLTPQDLYVKTRQKTGLATSARHILSTVHTGREGEIICEFGMTLGETLKWHWDDFVMTFG